MSARDPLREKQWLKSEDSWAHLRGKKIFFTGGTGFFGKSFLDLYQYYREHHGFSAEITVLSRSAEAFKARYPSLSFGINFVQGRVEDLKASGARFDHVFHMATPAEPRLIIEQPAEMFETIYVGQRRILEFAKESSAQSLLFTSSGAVYGRQSFNGTGVTEEYPGAPEVNAPDAAYGEGKRVAELLGNIWSHSTGIPFKIARCFAFLGPHLNFSSGHALGSFVRDAVRGDSIQIGNGRSVRSYLYSDDLITWLVTILAKGEACQPYNVGSDQGITISELAGAVQRVLRPECKIVDNTARSSILETQYLPNIDKARGLGLEALTPLDEAISRAAAGFRE